MQIDGLDTSLKSLQFRQASEVTGDDKEATELDTMAGFVRMSEINEPAKKTDKPVPNKSKSLAIWLFLEPKTKIAPLVAAINEV